MTPLADLPKTRAEIERIQSERKKIALGQARRAPLFKGKLDHVNADRLDDPDEWRKIPILDKDMLRQIGDQEFYDHFCVEPDDGIAEYWRSGGSTGTPRPMLERALAIYEKVLGPEHPNTNRARGSFARFLLVNGNAAEALACGATALEAHKNALGEDHPWTKNSAGLPPMPSRLLAAPTRLRRCALALESETDVQPR